MGEPKDFLELYDGGVGNTPLDGLYVIFFNGATNSPYLKNNLTSYKTDPNGYFLLGQPITNPDIVLPNGIQNGPDGGLLDAIVYGTSGAQGLLDVLLPGQKLVHENSSAPGDQGLSRCNCKTLLQNSCFLPENATSRAVNACPIPPTTQAPTTTTTTKGSTSTPKIVTLPTNCPIRVRINEVNAATGPSGNFVELWDGGTGNTSLTGFILLLFNPTSSTAYVHEFLSTYKTDANGYFVIGQIASHPNLVLPNNSPLITGAGAVGLYCTPPNFLLSNVGLVDAVVYNTGNTSLNAQAQKLLNVLLPGQAISAEKSTPDTSVSRCPLSCSSRLNSSCFQQALPTPGKVNNCPAFCSQNVLHGTFKGAGRNLTAAQLCGPNGVCINGVLGATCVCSPGYTGIFCQMMQNKLVVHQRCTLYPTNQTVAQNIPIVCPQYTLCIPRNHQCLFQKCAFPVGWCLPIN